MSDNKDHDLSKPGAIQPGSIAKSQFDYPNVHKAIIALIILLHSLSRKTYDTFMGRRIGPMTGLCPLDA